MFPGTKQLDVAATARGCQSDGRSAVGLSAPVEYGLSSAIQDLADEVRRTCELSGQLVSTLSIAAPDPERGKDPRDGMMAALRGLATALADSNDRLSNCLRHVNT